MFHILPKNIPLKAQAAAGPDTFSSQIETIEKAKIRFKSQRLHQQGLVARYLPELVSVKLINLKDNQGNPLTLYESDYLKLCAVLKQKKISAENFTHLDPVEKIKLLSEAKVKIIRYYSEACLSNYELSAVNSNFSKEGNIVTVNGTMLLKKGHQNCVVLQDGHIYAHPKVRSIVGDISEEVGEFKLDTTGTTQPHGRIGVSHSSLANMKKTQFSGSFVYNEEHGWIIENTTGHYATKAYQIRNFLAALKNKGFDISLLVVKTWIPKNPSLTPPSPNEADYITTHENAKKFLDRVTSSLVASQCILFSIQRKQRYVSAIKNPAKIDSSDFILLSTSIIETQKNWSKTSPAWIAKKDNPLHDLLDSIKYKYLHEDYNGAIEILNNFGNKYSEKLTHFNDNPVKNTSRRYFETIIAQLICDKISKKELISCNKFSDFLRKKFKKYSEFSFPDSIEKIKDIKEMFISMRNCADLDENFTAICDEFRKKSHRYQSKDRGKKKIDEKDLIYGSNSGIMKFMNPLPADECSNPQTNRVVDLFDIDKKKKGFSLSNVTTPFVNSISGTSYTFVLLLDEFLNTMNMNNTEEKQLITNDLANLWIAVSIHNGYHSYGELIGVLQDNITKKLLMKHPVSLHFSVPKEMINKAFSKASDYSANLILRKNMHAELTTLRKPA